MVSEAPLTYVKARRNDAVLTRVMGFTYRVFRIQVLRDRRRELAGLCLDMSLTFYLIAYHRQSKEYSLLMLQRKPKTRLKIVLHYSKYLRTHCRKIFRI